MTVVHPSSSVAAAAATALPHEQQRQVILGLNNHGVRLLQQRQRRRASQAFLSALNTLKRSIQQPKREDGDVDVHGLPPPPPQQQQQPQNYFTIQSIHNLSSSSSKNNNSEHDDDVVDLDHPISMFQYVFAMKVHDATTHNNRDGSIAALLYNMSVCHHVQALEQTKRQQQQQECHHQHHRQRLQKQCLLKSLQMYSLALSTVQHWAKTSSPSQQQQQAQHHDGIHLLRLAILNNMSHVQYLLYRVKESYHTLKCLRDIVGHAKHHLPRHVYNFFISNVIVLCMKNNGDDGDGDGSDTGSSKNEQNDGFMIAPAAAA